MEAKINKTIVDLLIAGSLFEVDEHGKPVKPVTFVADIETKGFNVRKLKSGTVSYGVKYRNREGTQRWLSLGAHGETTADIARRVAKQRLGEIAAGRDPAGKGDGTSSRAQ
jgi:Arm domain-containing DNA-binding protein